MIAVWKKIKGIELKPEINHKAVGEVKINLRTRKNRYSILY